MTVSLSVMPPSEDDERRWVESNRDIVERAFEVFLESGEWPKAADLRRFFAQRGRTLDIEKALSEKPRLEGQFSVAHDDTFRLRIRDLRYVPRAQPLIHVCLAATRRAVEAYLSIDAEPKVTSTDPAVAVMAGGDASLLLRAGQLLQAEHPGPLGGGGSGPDHWEYWVNDHTILDFKDVATPDAFVERQNEILSRAVEAAQATVMQQERLPTVARRVFVLMPFGPSWSRSVYEMIKRAVEALDSTAIVTRADDITMPGRISDQIVAEIVSADVVVADVTGLNANVMWELGYAHALGKAAVILNQDISASPFDLVDHRQLGYCEQSTAEDERQIGLFLRNALGL